MRSIIISLLVLSITTHARINPTKEQRLKVREMCAYQGPRTFLLSFPQSGNTWLRYCLEFLTKRPSFRRGRMQPCWNDFSYTYPIAWEAGFDIDEHKTLIEKIHMRQEGILFTPNHEELSLNPDADTLIFILRNPRETIARTEYPTFNALLDACWHNSYPHWIYFENLALFDSWPTEHRYLIYYEDLITAPRETLAGILAFLEESDARLDQFMDEYEYHKNRSLALYPKPTSRGSDPLFHSRKLSPIFCKQVDAWIAQSYPELWHQYLQRYNS